MSLASPGARRLRAAWVVNLGGEGIVLKDRRSIYKPGLRSKAWWKAKQKLTLQGEVLDCAGKLVAWGEWDRPRCWRSPTGIRDAASS
jgi:ATP-dependent DNA ligase